jgi:hypothetical protein
MQAEPAILRRETVTRGPAVQNQRSQTQLAQL